MAKYWLVLNNAPYTKHKTLAVARKAGDRLANSYPSSAKIEIWDARDVDDIQDLQGNQSTILGFLKQSSIDELGVEPVEYYE